jgi:molybdopterin-biosynthesis enzyme MoeA-like protein
VIIPTIKTLIDMLAEIITIGDEILIGQIVDTNSAWMAQKLNEEGIRDKTDIISI